MNRDELARALGISPDEQRVLDDGGGHPFQCRCETCRQWWKAVGPDDTDANGTPTSYGPFTPEEIERP